MSARPKHKLTANEAIKKLALNIAMTRAMLSRNLNMDKPGRDLNTECGYPVNPSIRDYRDYYENEGIANLCVRFYPDECWSSLPEAYETEDEKTTTPFEAALNETFERLNVWHVLHRADEISRIGHYGVILLGVNDRQDLYKPVRGFNDQGLPAAGRPVSTETRRLIYLQTYAEDFVEIKEYDTDPMSERYTYPKTYTLKTVDPVSPTSNTFKPLDVHWTRVVHLADNRKQSNVFGTPAMKPVLNRLYDIRKVLGGSAEMFWRGAFPGYSFETLPDVVEDAEMDEESVRQQFEDYANGLKRYLALTGVTAKSLAPQVADPSSQFATQVQAVSATLGVPLRIFLGSEAAHLASTQDMSTWNRRLARRQKMYLEPWVIRPFVDRLILLGMVPRPERFFVAWPDLNSVTEKDRADIGLKTTQALLQYVSSGAEKVMPLEFFLTLVLRFSNQEATAIMKAAQQVNATLLTKELWKSTQTALLAQRANTNPTAQTGAAGQRNGLGRQRNPSRGGTS